MSWLTKLARGQRCTIRLPCCNFDERTTVPAHYRSLRVGAGMGIKPDDLIVAFSCSCCHDVVDGRARLEGYTREQIRFAHAEGCLETWVVLIGLGKVGALKRGVEAA